MFLLLLVSMDLRIVSTRCWSSAWRCSTSSTAWQPKPAWRFPCANMCEQSWRPRASSDFKTCNHDPDPSEGAETHTVLPPCSLSAIAPAPAIGAATREVCPGPSGELWTAVNTGSRHWQPAIRPPWRKVGAVRPRPSGPFAAGLERWQWPCARHRSVAAPGASAPRGTDQWPVASLAPLLHHCHLGGHCTVTNSLGPVKGSIERITLMKSNSRDQNCQVMLTLCLIYNLPLINLTLEDKAGPVKCRHHWGHGLQLGHCQSRFPWLARRLPLLLPDDDLVHILFKYIIFISLMAPRLPEFLEPISTVHWIWQLSMSATARLCSALTTEPSMEALLSPPLDSQTQGVWLTFCAWG